MSFEIRSVKYTPQIYDIWNKIQQVIMKLFHAYTQKCLKQTSRKSYLEIKSIKYGHDIQILLIPFQQLSVKSVQIRSCFWSVFSSIQFKYRKIPTTNNSLYLDTFHAVQKTMDSVPSKMVLIHSIYETQFKRRPKMFNPIQDRLFQGY